MKHTTRLNLCLAIATFCLLSSCGGQASAPVTTAPNADSLVSFDENGNGLLHGIISSGGFAANATGKTRETIQLRIPAKVEGIKTTLTITFTLRPETEFSSSLTSQTMTVRDFNVYHAFDMVTKMFPPQAWAEVAFQKNNAEFEAVSFHEITQPSPIFQRRARVDGVFSTNFSSQGTLIGSFRQASIPYGTQRPDWWLLEVPVQIQGVKAIVDLTIQRGPDTQILTSKGIVPVDSGFAWGDGVIVEFTRKGDELIANQITVFR
jgi:hypothetical protein